MYYLYIENNNIVGKGQCKTNFTNIEVSQAIYDDYEQDKYIYQDGEIILNPQWEAMCINKKKAELNDENVTKANACIDGGYVRYKDAMFETNDKTTTALNRAKDLVERGTATTYNWLSMDDKVVQLELSDFYALDSLTAQFSDTVWNTLYINYKAQIAQAETVEELAAIVISYDYVNINNLIGG